MERKVIKIDAAGRTLGRLASEIVGILRGKGKVSFETNIDGGDFVLISNVEQIKVTGKKFTDKMYHRYSGYPGGVKSTNFAKLQAKNPALILRTAVYTMMPKNRTRDVVLKRLKFVKSK